MNYDDLDKEEPRILLGTVGEFEMRGLLIPDKLCDPVSGKPSDQLMVPARIAVMLTLKILERWKVPTAQYPAILGVTPEALESYREGRYPTVEDVLHRLEDILAIHTALTVLIPNDGESGTGWCGRQNQYFDGKKPIDIILTKGPRDVRRYLEEQP